MTAAADKTWPPHPGAAADPAPGHSGRTINIIPDPRHRPGQGSLPRAHQGPSFVSGMPATFSIPGDDDFGAC